MWGIFDGCSVSELPPNTRLICIFIDLITTPWTTFVCSLMSAADAAGCDAQHARITCRRLIAYSSPTTQRSHSAPAGRLTAPKLAPPAAYRRNPSVDSLGSNHPTTHCHCCISKNIRRHQPCHPHHYHVYGIRVVSSGISKKCLTLIDHSDNSAIHYISSTRAARAARALQRPLANVLEIMNVYRLHVFASLLFPRTQPTFTILWYLFHFYPLASFCPKLRDKRTALVALQ